MTHDEYNAKTDEIRDRLRRVAAREFSPTLTAEDIKDAIQDAILRGWQRLVNFDPAKGTFEGWLTMILIRICLRKLRTRRNHEPLDGVEVPWRGNPFSDGTAEAILECFATLPNHLRAAVALVYVDGLSYRDAAEQLNISEGALKGRAERGRERLRECLISKGYGPGAQ